MTDIAHLIYRVEHQGQKKHVICIEDRWSELDGDLFTEYQVGQTIEREQFRILAPVTPSKIVAVGLNYKDHAGEMNKSLPEVPLIFLKPSTAVIGPGDSIVLPQGVGRVDYEAELGLVIRKQAYQVSSDDALDFILGLTCVNDVTARELQRLDVQYTRAKGFDTFAPVGPAIAVGLDGSELSIEAWLNGTKRQSSNTRELIFSIEALVEFVSSVMTLNPGDIISTGTPSGVGPLCGGDTITIKISGIGELENNVQAG